MNRRFFSLLTGLLAGLLVMAGALPAIAQVDGITGINFKDLTAGQEVVGSHGIAVEVTSVTGSMIKTISVTVKSDAESDCAGTPKKSFETHRYDNGVAGASTASNKENISEVWDTNGFISPSLNGVYDIYVLAEGAVGFNDRSACLPGMRVNNAPKIPTGLAVGAPVRGDNRLGLSWAANPEGDRKGYRLSRSISGGPFNLVTSTVGTSYVDTGLPFDASISYKLVAYRASPVGPGGTIDSASTSATSPVTIQSPPPPPPPPVSGGGTGDPNATKSTGPGALSSDPALRLGSAAAPAGTAPVIIPPQAPIIGPHKDGGSGFNRLLDFGASPPKLSVDETSPGGISGALGSPGRLITQQLRVNPARFAAVAFLLLVTAGHLGRAARRLLQPPSGGGSPGTPATA